MDRFETPQTPILVRLKNGDVLCLIDYERKDEDHVVPIQGFNITSGYERLRAKDARRGVPLVDSEVEMISAGEVGYRAVASMNGWNESSWDDLDSDEREKWQIMGRAIVDFTKGDDVPFIY